MTSGWLSRIADEAMRRTVKIVAGFSFNRVGNAPRIDGEATFNHRNFSTHAIDRCRTDKLSSVARLRAIKS
jgi:hypothetical protein